MGMRCNCPKCGTYMIQAESLRLGCVCPECGAHCSDCLGTDTVISREAFRRIGGDPVFAARFAQDLTIRPSDSPLERAAPDDISEDELEKLRGDDYKPEHW